MLRQTKENIIKVGVISDTHIPLSSPVLPKAVREGLKGVNFIIHAGDFVTLGAAQELEKIAPLYAVSGNMDAPQVKEKFQSKREIEIAGFKIGIIHGAGGVKDLHLRARKEFQDVDIIIFGHSHKPFKKVVEGILMFNPGSPTDKIFADTNTFGMLELNKKIKARHIEI